MRYYWMMAAMAAAAPAMAQQDGTPPPPTPPSAGTAQAISRADFLTATRDRMLKADSNGDGKVSAAEWSAAMQARAGDGGGGGFANRMFTRMDTNQDGVIDTAEIDAASTQRFDRQDANGDGILTQEERQAARARMMEGRDRSGS